MDSPRTWDLARPALDRCYEVLTVTLPGHLGGALLPGAISDELFPDAVERVMDDAGLEAAHLAGNSLGGFVALQLATRGRARSVVALAPARASARGARSYACDGGARRRDGGHAGGTAAGDGAGVRARRAPAAGAGGASDRRGRRL
jgi:pimeloyl-ACP methyl ester carboxylesterase